MNEVATKSSGSLVTAWRLTRKDLLVGKRYLPIASALFLAYGSAAFVATEFYYVACAFLSVAIGISPIFIDSRFHGDLLFSSLPISRKQNVFGRYFSNLFVATGAAICSVLYGSLLGFLGGSMTISGFGDVWLFVPIIIAAVMVVSGIYYPFYFRYGLGKGSIVFAFSLIGVVALGYAGGLIAHLALSAPFSTYQPMSAFTQLVRSIDAISLGWLIATVVVVALYVNSGFLSARFYSRRDF